MAKPLPLHVGCATLSGAEKPSTVIPGRREAASPESRKAGNPDVLDSGLAPSARPGMTSWSFSAGR